MQKSHNSTAKENHLPGAKNHAPGLQPICLLGRVILHPKELGVIILVTFFYTVIPVYLMNYQFAWYMLTQDSQFLHKLYVLFVMFEGLFTVFSATNVILLFVTGFLVGVNIVLLGKTAVKKKDALRLRAAVSGSGIAGLISTGCASCGLSAVSFFGIGSALGIIPLESTVLFICAIGISAYSVHLLLQNLQNNAACEVKKI
jgi:hypothetical protein